MSTLLFRLARQGDISWLSYYFAEFIANHAKREVDDLLGLSAALVCEANQAGDVCIDLQAYDGIALFQSAGFGAGEIPHGIESSRWRAHLNECHCVGGPNQPSPLTLDGSRLYLNRYWHYENRVAERILCRLGPGNKSDNTEISRQLNSLFAASDQGDPDQNHAVTMAAANRFSVISGGPGTGKTTTVIRILATLIAQQPNIRIALAAPTGKAAARMMDSIRSRIDGIGLSPEARLAIPAQASTLHRLLGFRHRRYSYHGCHRLPIDCIVIDEASMIDLKLMFHLLDALPDHARIILLGDRDQLASVSAGNVLGDITGHGHGLEDSAPPIAATIALLRRGYRFDTSGGIGKLAEQVNLGHSSEALGLLDAGEADIRWLQPASELLDARAMNWILETYQPIFEADSVADALRIHEASRVLAATNQGPLGVNQLNRTISSALLAYNNRPQSEYYGGLPIMITRNHHELGLYNGDTGILWQQQQGLRACFRDGDGGIRSLSLNRLPEFAPAWASTVHKSQGSEYDSVLLILPIDPDSSALSRELLYTAITRARRYFMLHATDAALTRSIERLTRRHSGLAQRLGWPD